MSRKKVIPELVRDAVLNCGLSRYEIAKRSGVSEATLSRFIHGQRTLSIEILDKLAPHIGVEVVVRKPKRS